MYRKYNVTNAPLIPIEKIILPPLYIKLGVFKQFIKGLKPQTNKSVYEFLKKQFPNISEAKINEGIFVGRKSEN